MDGSGNVYVTGFFSDNAFKIEPGGQITQIIDSTGDGTGNNILTAPGYHSIAVDSGGNVYVAGEGSHNAYKIAPGGAITQIIDATGDGAGNTLSFPTGIAVDVDGNVYVTGSGSDNAFKIRPGGAITQIIDSSGDGAGNILDIPRDIAVDDGGNVYVVGQSSHNAFKISFVCGDGIINLGEECDDDNSVDGDGCSSTCTVEGGWECTDEPSTCTELCGDGMIVGSEDCDDEGESATCDADCTVAQCGDGTFNVTAGEECDGVDDTACPGACQADCTCRVAPDPLEAADDGGEADYNRVGDFKMPTSAVAGGQEVAIRVTLDRMYIDLDEDPANGCPVRQELPDLQAFEGQVRYLGPPEVFDNNALTDPKWIGAKLQCTPLVRDWSASALAAELGISQAEAGTIFYYGAEVVPCSIHAVQQATQSCLDSANEDCISDPLEVRTGLWGDIWSPFGSVNFTDIGKEVDAFKGIPYDPEYSGAPAKWRAMLHDNSPPFDSTISFTDIGKTVDAFKTIACPEEGPTACP